MKWMHQMMIPLTLMCWCVMSLDVGKLWMQPPTTQLVHYIIPDVSVWCGGVFSFLWVRCVLFKMRVVTNWGTKVLITPRDYRGDQRSEKKYFVMMRSLGPWEIAFLLLKSSRLRKWCIVWDVCRLKCVACTQTQCRVNIVPLLWNQNALHFKPRSDPKIMWRKQ